jgi:signal transduction histidine kinase
VSHRPRASLSSSPLLTRFVGITLVLVAALAWLGWRLLEQDRALERQRTRDLLEGSADLIAAGLSRALAAVDDTLGSIALDSSPAGAARFAATAASDAIVLVGAGDRVDAFPRGRLLYAPTLPALADPAQSLFARGDSLEFRAGDPVAAAAVYRELSRSRDAAVRAAALVRLGRAARKSNELRLASSAYDELARLDGATVNGVAAPIVARAARLALWKESGDSIVMRREAFALHDALHQARWRLSRSAFEFYDSEASRTLLLPPAPHGDSALATRMALSAAGAASWATHSNESSSPARARAVRVDDHSFLVASAARGDRTAVLLAGRAHVEAMLRTSVAPVLERQNVRVSLTDDDGRPVLAAAPPLTGSRLSRSPSDTRLPWTLHVAADPATDIVNAERQRLLVAGIVVAGLLALFGTYAVSRAASRELNAARLQSEFVAAVSHEFRTPLTSLRQLTELLTSGRVATPERRTEYYETMRRETARLHRFVEALLDFGRADAGIAERRVEPLDAVALVRATVADFERENAPAGFTIAFDAHCAAAPIKGDAEALGRALWNLLDNAVKYSGESRVVRVAVSLREDDVLVRVQDSGIGIAALEHQTVWEKFRRGTAARERGIRGTGIGLAFVRQIIAAHGGSVALESAPGAGSTFTIGLPLAAGQA